MYNEKRILYFYPDKALYTFIVIGLYLGFSLFTLINMSVLGQVIVAFSSLVLTGGVINFIARKGQIIRRIARLILLLMIMLSINFYTYLLNNITVYSQFFILTHLLGLIIACAIYRKLLCTNNNNKIIAGWFCLSLLLVLLFGYLKIGASLSFLNTGAITLFTFIQIGSITPIILVIWKPKQFFLVCKVQEEKQIDGVVMKLYSTFVFLLLLVWDFLFVFLVYKLII